MDLIIERRSLSNRVRFSIFITNPVEILETFFIKTSNLTRVFSKYVCLTEILRFVMLGLMCKSFNLGIPLLVDKIRSSCFTTP